MGTVARVGAVVAMVATVLISVGVSAAAPAGATEPGHPGTPQPATVLFHEDFENVPSSPTPVALASYVGVGGETYTASTNWLDPNQCNGIVISGASPDYPAAGCSSANQDRLRELSVLLGGVNGTSPTDANYSVSAYTAGDPGVGIEFQTTAPVSLSAAVDGRFLTFSVNVAAVNCHRTHPLLSFSLVDETAAEFSATASPIDPCAAAPTVGTYTSDGSVLFSGSELGIIMRNQSGSGTGNDHAFDDIRVLDATPQLDKAFDPAQIFPGQTSTLTLTVTNTTDLAAKVGWSLVDTLPVGVTLASLVNPVTTCGAGTTIVADPFGASFAVNDGNLPEGAPSCTISVDVTSDALGTHTNGPANMTMTGLNPPADTVLTVAPQPTFSCSPDGLLFQAPSPTSATRTISAVDLVSGDVSPVANDYYPTDINAVGYNVLDNYVYGVGVGTATSPAHLVRVGGDGSVVPFAFPAGVPVASYHIGDVDANGHMWISNGANWYEIDASDPASATYMTLLDFGSIAGASFADWAYVPGTNSLYTIASAGGSDHLYRFDLGTHAFVDEGDLGSLGGGFGAVFADSAGYLYASQNATGQIYRVEVSSATGTLFAPGPASGGNDGARCATAAVLVDFGDAPDTYGTTLAADGARHGVRGFDSATSTAPLMLGDSIDSEADGVAGDMADGDNLAGVDDELGGPIVYVPDEPLSTDITITNLTGGPATLAVWLDVDRNGVFDEAPTIVPVASGSDHAAVNVALGTLTGEADTYARFRLFPGDVAGPQPIGAVSAGEVEDVLVVVAAPALALDKTAVLDDANVNGAADVGEVIAYSFLVTNTGNTAVTGITVQDPLPGLSPIECPAADLAASTDMTCTATYLVTQADVDAGEVANSATAGGESPRGPITSPPSEAIVDAVEAAPGLSIVKTADLDDVSNSGEADEDEIITYTFVVTNTGNVTMSDVTVVDSLPGLSPVTCPTDVLAPAEVMTCTATYTVTADDLGGGHLENEATATGVPPAGGDPISSAPSQASTPLAAGPSPSIVERVASLAYTGASIQGVVVLGLLLLLVGSALVVRSRWIVSVRWVSGLPSIALRARRRGGAHLRRLTVSERFALSWMGRIVRSWTWPAQYLGVRQAT